MARHIDRNMTLKQVLPKLRMGRAVDWEDLPERATPEIWKGYGAGEAGLEQMLQACPEPRFFMSWVLFSHLLDPSQAPDECRSWLKHQDFAALVHCSLSLGDLEGARWRRVIVPVVAENGGAVKWMFVGAGQDLPLFPAGAAVFDCTSRAAVECARSLVAETWDRSLSVWPMRPDAGSETVTGPSLGLPLYLGAASACLELSGQKIAATGALSESGKVQGVAGVREKLHALPDDIEVFLYPQESENDVVPVLDSGVKCAQVETVEQAVAALLCDAPLLVSKGVAAQAALDANIDVARTLCSLSEGMDGWVKHFRESIARALHVDDRIGELIGQIGIWCHSTTGKDAKLGNAILDCMDVRFGMGVAEKESRLGWDLALLQMDKANHRGDLDACSAWKGVAEGLLPKILRISDNGEREHLVYYVRSTIGDCHNRYRFDPDLPAELLDAMALGPTLKVLENMFESRLCRIGPCQDSVLGRYYGTLGQHFLFCGPKFFSKGMEFLDRAMAAFGSGELPGTCREEWSRDLFYQAFGLLEAGHFQEAEEAMAGVWERPHGTGWPVEKLGPFECHWLLRLHVDGKRQPDSDFLDGVRCLVRERDGHPGQLLAYNFARLLPDDSSRREWYKCSLQRCLSPYAGPTIRAMALLPLSRMHVEGMELEDFEEKCAEVREVLEDGSLDRNHFRCVLKAETWQEMLEMVVERERGLFPYMYR